ncbi:protein translocase subunit SecD [Desulfoluna limicola]|uniref:Protein translocase subunit SecD n=1 Tax=Desulfoluna limicola TaxID=2810562 RepID=A0ABM7PG66_9BACT|nr:protein translocase subunit SecD [Desulfoluna limicola]BCS96137.1 protein translocase subunit SecD [Desulfoluna limicola]
MKNLSWRLIAVLVVIVMAAVFILPTATMYLKGTNEPDMWPHKKINLGLDLQGGMHLVLEVQTEKAVENAMSLKISDIRQALRKIAMKNRGVALVDQSSKLNVKLLSPDDLPEFKGIIADDFPDLEIASTSESGGVTLVTLAMKTAEAERVKKFAADQALETIRNRIDEFGVSEPDIRKQGENRIQIQLPGITDTKSAKDLIGKTATLQFRLVDEDSDVRTALETHAPAGSELLYLERKDATTGAESSTPMLIKKRVLLTGDSLTDARVLFDNMANEPYVSIEFDRKGGHIFSKVTGDNINRRLAIVLDDTVYSAPVIRTKIPGGKAQITGGFTMEEARVLAIALRAGALPAPVKILEERTVGPTLGADSIRKGVWSMLMGGLVVILFMAVYYKGAGLIADLALVLNVTLIAAGLAAFQATLTLPGIAGIILTIGMAVDANVLIFERIREELNLGQSPIAAVEAGFEKATLTIMDANVTTLIAAIVLFQFGSGPVKGFAVTLGIGILSSLFTALVVSRLLFDSILRKANVKTLSI